MKMAGQGQITSERGSSGSHATYRTRTSQRKPKRHFRQGKPQMRTPKANPFEVTSLPVSLSVMRNDTFCTTTIGRKKHGKRLHMRTRSHLVRAASGDVTSGCACAHHHIRQLHNHAPPPQIQLELYPYTTDGNSCNKRYVY